MSFPPSGVKFKSESTILTDFVDDRDRESFLPSGVASKSSSPRKTKLNKNIPVASSYDIAKGLEGGRVSFSHRNVIRHMQLIKAVFPQNCHQTSSSCLSHLITKNASVVIQGCEFSMRKLVDYNIKIYCGQGNEFSVIGSGKFGSVIPFKLHNIQCDSASFVFKTEKKISCEEFVAAFKNPPKNLAQLYPLKEGFLQAPLRAKLACELARELKLAGLLPCIEVALNNHQEYGTLMTEIKGVTADTHLRNLRDQGSLRDGYEIDKASLKTFLKLGLIDESVYSAIVLLDYLCGRHDRSKLKNIMVIPHEENSHRVTVKLIDMDLCFPTENDSLGVLYTECSYYRHHIVDLLKKASPGADSDSDSGSGESVCLTGEQKAAIARKQKENEDRIILMLKLFGAKIEFFLGGLQNKAFVERVGEITSLISPIPTTTVIPDVYP